MKESTFTTLFAKWFKNNWSNYSNSGLIECKVTCNTFNLKEWKLGKQSHQFRNLFNATKKKGVIWKIADSDTRTKPVDIFFVSKSEGYLVIYFINHKEFTVIPYVNIPKAPSINYAQCKNLFGVHKLPTKKQVKEYTL